MFRGWHESTLSLNVPLALAKVLVWTLLVGFLAYSIYCSSRENLFLSGLHWGRQIGLDLYLGLFLTLFIIYLNEGALAALFWLIPTLLSANLSILLYFAIHFDSIVRDSWPEGPPIR